MNPYDRWLLPFMLDLAMRHRELARYRTQVAPRARGVVLEVGAGSGLNFAYYGDETTRVLALDPSPPLLRKAKARAANATFPVEFIALPGERIPLPDRSVDSVVMTWTLCSIPDPGRALREIRRVLRPAGRLLFAEHGCAPDAAVASWQRRLTGIWSPLAGGCHLDRRIDDLIRAAGFEFDDLRKGYARLPRLLGYMYVGSAVSASRAGKRGDDRAGARSLPVPALVDEALEQPLHAPQIGDALPDDAELVLGKRARAGAVLPVLEEQELADLGEREAELLRALDEVEAGDGGAAVAAHRARGTRRLGHQAEALVVADRLLVDAGLGGDLADGEGVQTVLRGRLASVGDYRV